MQIDQENKLELILKLAATEPAHRPEFCTELLSSTVYVLGDIGTEPVEHGRSDLATGSMMNIHHWEKQDGSAVIPFFSSLEVLSKSLDCEQSYVALPARALFEMTLGATLFLNPKSDYGKEFVPQEVEQLLNTGGSQTPVQRVLEKSTKVLLGEPANYPSKMVDSLTQLLAKHKDVKYAYVALMHDTAADEKPHLVIGIQGEGDLSRAMQEAGAVAGDTAPEKETVDIFLVEPDDKGLSQYFINSTPFYKRSWGSKLRSYFGSGNA